MQTLNTATIRAIEYAISKGDRVEVIPVKDGIKLVHIKRSVISEQKEACSKR